MKPEIESEIAKGKFVVVEEYPIFCRITDALIGSGTTFVGSFDSRQDADKKVQALYESEGICGGDSNYDVFPLEPTPFSAPALIADEILPF